MLANIDRNVRTHKFYLISVRVDGVEREMGGRGEAVFKGGLMRVHKADHQT